MSQRVLYLDTIGGASGDMICAALLDVGVSIDAMRDALAELKLPNLRVELERAARYAISAELATSDTG